MILKEAVLRRKISRARQTIKEECNYGRKKISRILSSNWYLDRQLMGRRGALDVRGSLEEQTMNMAKSAAKLFEENLRYSNGEPVKVLSLTQQSDV